MQPSSQHRKAQGQGFHYSTFEVGNSEAQNNVTGVKGKWKHDHQVRGSNLADPDDPKLKRRLQESTYNVLWQSNKPFKAGALGADMDLALGAFQKAIDLITDGGPDEFFFGERVDSFDLAKGIMISMCTHSTPMMSIKHIQLFNLSKSTWAHQELLWKPEAAECIATFY
jgi:hypothetical protein